jgi:phosphatidate cytidylyltransferase
LKQRIISGLMMVPLLLVIYLGNYVLMAACFLGSFFALREFYQAFERATGGNRDLLRTATDSEALLSALESVEPSESVDEDDRLSLGDLSALDGEIPAAEACSANSLPIRPSYVVGCISIVLLYGLAVFLDTSFIMIWFVLVVILSFLSIFRLKAHSLTDGFVTMVGIFYVVFFVFHIVLAGFGNSWVDSLGSPIRIFSDNWLHYWRSGFQNPVWLVVLAAFGTDIFAYFTGLLFGRHKLAPNLSPKKTIEGAVGGLVGSVLLCGLFGYFFLPDLFYHTIAIGVLGSGAAQVGDLTASLIKRKLGIKDYGKLIPGHGGFLDRFDSLLFTAPLVFYYMNIYGYVWQMMAQTAGS